jgi:hypothetical protein
VERYRSTSRSGANPLSLEMTSTTPFKRSDFTAELAREWFAYDPVAGIVIRTKNSATSVKTAGKPAASFHKPSGYMQVQFRKVYVYEQQLVWALVAGYWSPHKLGHRDGNKTNNRFENLFERTNQGNDYIELQSSSESSRSGVVPLDSGRFRAQIFREKMLSLGTFATSEEAHKAYLRAKAVLHSPLNREKPTLELLSQVMNVS